MNISNVVFEGQGLTIAATRFRAVKQLARPCVLGIVVAFAREVRMTTTMGMGRRGGDAAVLVLIGLAVAGGAWGQSAAATGGAGGGDGAKGALCVVPYAI